MKAPTDVPLAFRPWRLTSQVRTCLIISILALITGIATSESLPPSRAARIAS